MMQEFRVTVESMTETYEYHINVDMEQYPDPEDAEGVAGDEAEAEAIWDGMDQTDWFHVRVEYL